MNKIRRHYVFRGEVQGVGFRFQACMAAQSLGLTGWVKNEYDGSVSMEIQGTESAIDKAVEMIGNSRYISIESFEVMQLPYQEDEREFRPEYW